MILKNKGEQGGRENLHEYDRLHLAVRAENCGYQALFSQFKAAGF